MMQIFRSETIFFGKSHYVICHQTRNVTSAESSHRSARLLQSLLPILQFHHLHLKQNVIRDMYKLLTLFTLFPLFCCKHCSSICSAKNNVGDKFGEFSRLVAINVKYAYQGAYLGAPNMVKWGVPEKILQKAVQTCWS